MDQQPQRTALYIGLAVVLTVGVFGVGVWYLILQMANGNKLPAEVVLVMVIALLLNLLLTILLFMALIFNLFDLSDTTQALSLPTGSVRALLALFLVIIFAVMAIFLFQQVRQDSSIVTFQGISAEMLADIPVEERIAIIVNEQEDGPPTYDVRRQVQEPPVGEASDRLAQQIFSTVSTLVVAVAGFYFGTRSVQVAQKSMELPPEPVVNKIENSANSTNTGTPNTEVTCTITGERFNAPQVRLSRAGAADVQGVIVEWQATQITCRFSLTEAGIWDVVVQNADGGKGVLPTGFEVKEAAA